MPKPAQEDRASGAGGGCPGEQQQLLETMLLLGWGRGNVGGKGEGHQGRGAEFDRKEEDSLFSY